MKLRKTAACALAALAFVAGGAADKPAEKEDEAAAIRATGTGYSPRAIDNPARARAMARRASELVAIRNLAALAGGARVDGDPRSGTIWVRGLVKGYKIVSQKTNADGSVTTVVELPVSELARNFKVPLTRAELLQHRVGALELEVDALREVLSDTVGELAVTQVRLEARTRESRHLRAEIRRLHDLLARHGIPPDAEAEAPE